MTTGKALNGKPYAGNPHVRFDEGEVASAATPRRGSLLYKKLMMFLAMIAFVGNRICKLGSLIIALVMLVSSGCRTPVIPDGVYMADDGESKITMAGNEAELDLLLEPEKKKRYVAQGTVVNGSGTCPDGISGQPIYFITTSTQFSPFEICELSWFYDGQNILAVYPDKKTVAFTLNEAVGSQKTYKHHEGRP